MHTLHDAIREFPIVQWARDNFPKVYETSGENFFTDCFCCGGKRKLAIDRNYRSFHCFACDPGWGGKGGSTWDGKAHLVKMIQLIEHLSQREAIERIYKLAGLPDVPALQRSSKQEELPKCISLRDCRRHDAALYLEHRGVGHLVETASVCVDGKYAYRVILPTRYFDETTGFEAKSYFKDVKPKSLFPTSLYTSDTVYTTKDWDSNEHYAVVTESILDAETVRHNAIGLYGCNLGVGQLQRLLELRGFGIHKLYWALDSDAWWKQAKLIVKNTTHFFENWFVPLPSGEDPNSLGSEGIAECIRQAVRFEDELDMLSIYSTFS